MKTDYFVTGVFCFITGETIPTVFYNVLGCCHDSLVANCWVAVMTVWLPTGVIFMISLRGVILKLG
jgi:hypothetical protein